MTTRLIGREREGSALRRLVLDEGARLVTVVGPPGVGKTRVASEISRQLADRFDHGTVFVDLSPLIDAALVPTAVARAAGVREVPDRPVMERLAPYLENSASTPGPRQYRTRHRRRGVGGRAY